MFFVISKIIPFKYLYWSKITMKSILNVNVCHCIHTNHYLKYYFLICEFFGVLMYRQIYIMATDRLLKMRLRNSLIEKCCNYFFPLSLFQIVQLSPCSSTVPIIKLDTRWQYKPPKPRCIVAVVYYS